ncbi:MAG: hypothetical protein R3C14_31175 [Caldilineaceae bacterium]
MRDKSRFTQSGKLLLILWILSGCIATSPDSKFELIKHTPAWNVERLGQLGGPMLTVAVQDKYAYVGHSFEFAVLNIADPNHPSRIGALSLATNDIVLTLDRAYVGGRDGLTIIDISNPAQPTIIGALFTTAAVTAIALVNQVVYLLNGNDGLLLVDVSHPSTPKRISNLAVTTQPEGLAVTNGYLYMAAYEGLFIIDVTAPTHPRQIGFTTTGGWARSVTLVGPYAYVTAGGGLAIVDITDHTQPTLLSYLPIAEYSDAVSIVKPYAYVSAGISGVQVIDIGNPKQPRQLSKLQLSGHPRKSAVAGAYLYVANLEGRLHVIDRRDPHKLKEAGLYLTPGPVWRIVNADHMLYLAAGVVSSLHLVDAKVPAALREIGYYATTSDISALTVQGRYVHTLDSQGDFATFDVVNPANPQLISQLHLPIAAQALTVTGDIAQLRDNHGRLIVMNLANKSAPVITTDCKLNVPLSGGSLSACALEFMSRVEPLVSVPLLAALSQQGIAVEDITMVKSLAFVAAGEAGLFIFDVSNPTHPIIVGFHDTPGFAYQAAVEQGCIYVADGLGGLNVFSYIGNKQRFDCKY